MIQSGAFEQNIPFMRSIQEELNLAAAGEESYFEVEKFYDQLLNHRTFGPIIYKWRAHRSIPKQAKWVALTFIFMAFGLSTYVYFHLPLIWAPLDLFGVGLFIFIARIPHA